MIEDLLRSRGALLQGHFLLSSGLHSDSYVQCARIFENPRDAQALGEALSKKCRQPVEFVVSPALGGILIGYEVARALGKPFLFTERSDGNMALRRGFRVLPKSRGLIVEDVITTGRSTIEVAALIRACDGAVAGVSCVLDRTAQGLDLGVGVHSLLKLPLSAWPAADCPLCRAGELIDKPGSRPASPTHPRNV